MKSILHVFSFCLLFMQVSIAQKTTPQNVFTEDIDHFWTAYDSATSTRDSLQQIRFLQTLYVDKASPGLKAFMKARNYSTELYVKLIRQYPAFWNSIRPNTLAVKNKIKELEASITTLKKIYPGLKNATLYFTIGGLRSGGTVTDSMVLIGAEIATGNAATNVSEFPSKWLAGVFREQSADNLVSLNIHEYIHTQQKEQKDERLLSQAIAEGSCDFIAELVMGKPLPRNYITYGEQHKQELKEAFQKEMFLPIYSQWLYNGSNAKTVADLGYFMGYDICKSYYAHSHDKKQAVKDIIELDYSDSAAVETFLQKSKYYTEPINKELLVQSFRSKQPQLLRLEPFANGDTRVDPSLKQLTLVFSKPMGEGFSINNSERGREFSPLKGVVGFSEDRTRFTLKIELQPNHEYEFIVTNRSFASSDGFPLLKEYPVRFTTQP